METVAEENLGDAVVDLVLQETQQKLRNIEEEHLSLQQLHALLQQENNETLEKVKSRVEK